MFLQLAPHEEVEFLVRAAQFDVRFERHRIVALHQGVEKLVDGDGLPAGVALGEIVAFQHARDGVGGGKANDVHRGHAIHPGGIEHHFGLLGFQNLEHLFGVRPGVFLHLLAGERRARHVLAGGVADHAGEVADEKQRVMPQILQLTHLVEKDGVPEVQVGRGGIEPRLDTQRPPLGKFFLEFAFHQQLVAASLDDAESFVPIHFGVTTIRS
jgi:hypothetical protein